MLQSWNLRFIKYGKKTMIDENIPFGGNMKVPTDDCEEAFFELYPDFFYEKSTALTLWTQGWQAALDYKESTKPLIQLI
jgi:hypothetical protein